MARFVVELGQVSFSELERMGLRAWVVERIRSPRISASGE